MPIRSPPYTPTTGARAAFRFSPPPTVVIPDAFRYFRVSMNARGQSHKCDSSPPSSRCSRPPQIRRHSRRHEVSDGASVRYPWFENCTSHEPQTSRRHGGSRVFAHRPGTRGTHRGRAGGERRCRLPRSPYRWVMVLSYGVSIKFIYGVAGRQLSCYGSHPFQDSACKVDKTAYTRDHEETLLIFLCIVNRLRNKHPARTWRVATTQNINGGRG